MTRENKAGIVVSASFLCLVGAVVAVKLRGPAPAETEAGEGEARRRVPPARAEEAAGTTPPPRAARRDPAGQPRLGAGRDPGAHAIFTPLGGPASPAGRASAERPRAVRKGQTVPAGFFGP